MLPIPLEDYIPDILRNNPTDTGDAFLSKNDSLLIELRDEIFELYYLKVVARCPEWLLEELGAWLNANLNNIDSEDTKRQKIASAIATHKVRGSWTDDVKLRIDSITGYDSAIITEVGGSDWILTGDGETPSAYYWGSMGADGVDADLGLDLIGSGEEIEIPWNRYINCHVGITVSTLSSAVIDQIVAEIKDDEVPAYMRVFLGYVDGSGDFQLYSGGAIY